MTADEKPPVHGLDDGEVVDQTRGHRAIDPSRSSRFVHVFISQTARTWTPGVSGEATAVGVELLCIFAPRMELS
jgi:hypothetical protein